MLDLEQICQSSVSIYEQFVVGVARPNGGWSKGRPIAYIEEDDKCVPLVDLLIPNDLDDQEIVRYVGDKFRAFAQAGKRVALLTRTPIHARQIPRPAVGQRGVAHLPAFAGVQR